LENPEDPLDLNAMEPKPLSTLSLGSSPSLGASPSAANPTAMAGAGGTRRRGLTTPTAVDAPRRVGLLAGWGHYPIVLARALKRQGCCVCCLGVKDHADPILAQICDDFTWIGLAKLGHAIRYFRQQAVREACMGGKFHKMLIYQKWAWLKHLPDLHFLRTFYPHFITARKDQRDDTLLTAIVDAFAAAGIDFRPATDYAPELLVAPGVVAGKSPSYAQHRDMIFGWEIAKEMGRVDVGQSVCVKDRAVLSVEAIEGTDACIRRAGMLCGAGGFTVVKVAKPRQDMRFDVPTVGLGTLESMVVAGGRTLAIEANRTILLDQQRFIDYARSHKIVVVALQREIQGRAAA